MVERVLLVCSDDNRADILIDRLGSEGFHVVGPAPNAAAALCLASVTFPDLALVATPPSGRRGASEMARELAAIWGVGSVVLKEALADGEETSRETHWIARPDQLQRLDRVLSET